ncbi:MAG: glycoside hydrolase [Actinomycetota bacterium]|nr:glycoside hydrolase [Actinomycetota bacterium]
MAVSGKNVVVGYNDDGKSPLFFQPTVDLSGYSWSSDGGKTFKDSRLPNREPGINIGDPVLATDRAGNFYYGTLDLDYSTPLLGVAVGRSDDGGRSFHTPTIVSRNTGFISTQDTFSFVVTDKPWLAVGANPRHPKHDIIYATWTEDYFTYSRRGFAEGSRIMLTSSPDLGKTWSRPRAVFDDRITSREEHRGTFHFVSGSNIAVDRTGRVYVGWERFSDDGTFTYKERQEWLSHSTDAGGSFSAPTLFAKPSPVGTLAAPLACANVLQFGPGEYVRTQEFPMLGIGPGGDLYAAYNSGHGPGRSSIRVARSDDRGRSWFTKTLQTGGTAFMPAIAASSSGVDVIYYEQTSKFSMKTTIARSGDGFSYSKYNLSDATFRMPQTLPPYDPSIAPCYMGDYLGATRQGQTTYTAWGDNRDSVTNDFWPKGRPDPNVFFARVG